MAVGTSKARTETGTAGFGSLMEVKPGPMDYAHKPVPHCGGKCVMCVMCVICSSPAGTYRPDALVGGANVASIACRPSLSLLIGITLLRPTEC